MEQKKRSSIGNRILFGIIVFALLLIVAISVPVGLGVYYMRLNDYTESAFTYTREAAGMIEGDRIAGYLETGEKDEYYNTVLAYLNSAQKESTIKYYYVFVPYENDLVYVWDAVNEDGACELGEHEEYMEGGKEAVEKIYRKDPPEEIKVTKDDKYGFIASAFSPVFNSAGEPVAVVGVDLSMPGLAAMIRHFIAAVVLIIAIASALMMAVSYIYLRRRLIDPIRLLTEKAGEMVDNLESDETVSIDIHTNDELETLSESFVKMDVDLRKFISKLESVTAEKEGIGAELNIAANIQASMLPRIFPPFPERKEFDIYASMNPAKEVGGDFYDFFLIDDDHLGIVIADVSGKGVPAALFMAISKVLIKNCALPGMTPGEVLETVNERLCRSNDTGLFVTVWFAIIEISTGKGMSANAGHEHPALYKQSSDTFELIKYKHSPAVAVMEGLVFRDREFKVEPGDIIFVYTDGVTEASDSKNVLFGEDRLAAALNKCPVKEPRDILLSVGESIDEFVGDADQFDDITMLSLRYVGPQKS